MILAGPETTPEAREQMLSWLKDGVSIREFMKPFDGKYDGRTYKADIPPPYEKANHVIPEPHFRQYASDEFKRLEEIGAIKCVTKKPAVSIQFGW